MDSRGALTQLGGGCTARGKAGSIWRCFAPRDASSSRSGKCFGCRGDDGSPDGAEAVVATVRASRPDVMIVARAHDAAQSKRLYQLGVTDAVPETVEASLQLSEALLVGIGIPMGAVIASIHERRDDFRKELNDPNALGDSVLRDTHAAASLFGFRSKFSQCCACYCITDLLRSCCTKPVVEGLSLRIIPARRPLHPGTTTLKTGLCDRPHEHSRDAQSAKRSTYINLLKIEKGTQTGDRVQKSKGSKTR